MENGYRARCFEPEDLAPVIERALKEAKRRLTISEKHREKILSELTLKKHAKSYIKICTDLLEKAGS